jgi:hypothetical protein
MDDESLTELLNIPELASLTKFRISQHPTGMGESLPFDTFIKRSNLVKFEMKSCGITDELVKRISAAIHDSKLEVVKFPGTPLEGGGLNVLFGHLKGSKVKTLDLSDGETGEDDEEELLVIQDGFRETALVSLDMQNSGLDDVSGETIAKALEGSSIKVLNLSGNSIIGTLTCTAIGKVLKSTQLEELYLSGCYLGDAEAEALSKGISGSRLVKLVLNACAIGPLGVIKIAAAIKESQLRELDLRSDYGGARTYNDIDESCLKALAEYLPGSKMRILLLGIIKKTTENGLANFIRCLSRTNIVALTLGKVAIGDVENRAFIDTLPNSKIRYLQMEPAEDDSGMYDNSPMYIVCAVLNRMGRTFNVELAMDSDAGPGIPTGDYVYYRSTLGIDALRKL